MTAWRDARAVFGLRERQSIFDRDRRFPAGRHRLFKLDAQDIFVLPAHLPRRAGGNFRDAHIAVAAAVIVRLGAVGAGNGRERRALAVGVAVQVEFERGHFALLGVMIGKRHFGGENAALVFGGNIVFAPRHLAARAPREGKQRQNERQNGQKQDETLHAKPSAIYILSTRRKNAGAPVFCAAPHRFA